MPVAGSFCAAHSCNAAATVFAAFAPAAAASNCVVEWIKLLLESITFESGSVVASITVVAAAAVRVAATRVRLEMDDVAEDEEKLRAAFQRCTAVVVAVVVVRIRLEEYALVAAHMM
jgi:hypothetical protein